MVDSIGNSPVEVKSFKSLDLYFVIILLASSSPPLITLTSVRAKPPRVSQ
jgi:hypothetical protein